MAKRRRRFLGAAAAVLVITAVPAVAGASCTARGPDGFVDLSPGACLRDLDHAAAAGSIEGCVAGASGRLAFLVGNRFPAPDSHLLTQRHDEAAFAGGFGEPAAAGVPGRPAAGPGPAAVSVFSAADVASSRTGTPAGSGGTRSGFESAAAPVLSRAPILAISSARVYPNPFNPAFTNTTIEYVLSKDARVQITAYDWTGAFVDRVYQGPGTAGTNAQEWGGQTEDGRKLANGVYLIRIVATTDARTESQVLKAVVWNDG